VTKSDNQSPLTILIAADTYPPHVNGAAQFGYRLAKGMTARGHNVHVLACRPGKGASYSEFSEEATVHRLRSHSVPTHEYFRVTFPWEIKKEISLLFDRIQPDVVHIQSHYMIGEHVLYEAVKRGIRVVATNHFMPENLNPFLPFPQWFKDIVGRISWRDMGKVMGQADVVTTPTPLAAKAMHQHAFLRKVLPLSNGIDAAAYELRPDETVERHASPTALFVGRLAEEKHVDVLIDAVAKTPRALDIHLEVVGPRGPGRPARAVGQGQVPRHGQRRRPSQGLHHGRRVLHARHGGTSVPGDSGGDVGVDAGPAGQRHGAAAPGARRGERLPLHAQ
jgi:1,2-diacylglycerol 3-alpha-glucosyltransferase